MEALIEQLKQARQAKGWSQADLGQQLGWPQSHISKLEAGKVEPRLNSVIQWARILDLECMLIPREMVRLTQANLTGDKAALQQRAWLPDEGENDDDA